MKTSRSKSTFHILALISLLISLIGGAMFVTPAYAAGFVVTKTADTADGICAADCSLREAIIAANAAAGNDIVTVPAGTYTLTIAGIDEDAAATGDLDLTSNITINGAGVNSTFIEGGTSLGTSVDRVFHVTGAFTVNISGVTVRNGDPGSNSGGGIYNPYGTLTITDSAFSGNKATSGGGGIYNAGMLTVTNSTLYGNGAYVGGGIYSYSGIVSVTNSTLSANSTTSSGSGGGIFIYSGILNVTNSTLSFNGAPGPSGLGGGITIDIGTANVTNSTLYANNAGNEGGGIYIDSGTANVTNSTLFGNIALGSGDSGGGIFNLGGTLNYGNTIIANSSGGDCIGSGTIGTNTHNLVRDNTCLPALSGVPNLGALTGSPAYFPLNAGSPAIDAGNDAVCAAAPVSNTSQNGTPRPQGTHCDIGSYETNITINLRSIGAQDGWVLESSENSNAGGTPNATATTFNLGDGAADKQYRVILHFNTSGLPDSAVITRATLMIRKNSLVGTDPFTLLGYLRVDMRKPFFGTTTGLVIGDFQAAAGKSSIAAFSATPVANWYSAVLNATARAYINRTGTTQFRLRFQTDDNNDNGADYMKFFSGDYATTSLRPTLTIEFYVP